MLKTLTAALTTATVFVPSAAFAGSTYVEVQHEYSHFNVKSETTIKGREDYHGKIKKFSRSRGKGQNARYKEVRKYNGFEEFETEATEDGFRKQESVRVESGVE